MSVFQWKSVKRRWGREGRQRKGGQGTSDVTSQNGNDVVTVTQKIQTISFYSESAVMSLNTDCIKNLGLARWMWKIGVHAWSIFKSCVWILASFPLTKMLTQWMTISPQNLVSTFNNLLLSWLTWIQCDKDSKSEDYINIFQHGFGVMVKTGLDSCTLWWVSYKKSLVHLVVPLWLVLNFFPPQNQKSKLKFLLGGLLSSVQYVALSKSVYFRSSLIFFV